MLWSRVSCCSCRLLFILLNDLSRDAQEIEAAKKIVKREVRPEPSELLETIKTAEAIQAVEKKFVYIFFQRTFILMIVSLVLLYAKIWTHKSP